MKSRNTGAAYCPAVAEIAKGSRLVEAHVDAHGEVGGIADEHTSFASFVVPVLPASVLPTLLMTVAVPRWTTPSIIEVIW